MHHITALFISLTTVLLVSTGVQAGGCPGVSTTPSNKGFATFWDVEPTWMISEFGEEADSKVGVDASSIFDCTDRCWRDDDCNGASWEETGDWKQCYFYLTGVPGPMWPKKANKGLTAVAWKKENACDNPEIAKHEEFYNPQDPHECCSIWMGHA